ncbi:MAG: DUF6261 family protein [Fibromonadaceae bacterium]|jgi:hypothetical protein|nr:DUF6261 family protein [Fibromonadaceae bacterium]
MKISNLDLAKLRNDAHFQFHTEFKDIVAKNGADTLKIGQQFQSYLPLYDRVDIALKKINKSIFTEQIQEADKARDEIWNGIIDMNKAALKHFNSDTRDAAKKLKIVFDTYGNIAKKPLNEQTSATYNILQELEGKYANDVVAVGIGQWVAELKARNNAFGDLMKERFDESALKTDIVLKEARMELDKVYRTIVERINALVIVEGAAAYEAFIKTLNIIIKKYTPKRRRKGGGVEEIEEEVGGE